MNPVTVTEPETELRPHQDTRKSTPHRGAGYAIVLESPSGSAPRLAQWRYRAPSGSASRSFFPATRKAAGAPSAWSQPPQSTHARPRRWCDAGSPGRQCVTAAQKAGDAGAASVPVAVPVDVAAAVAGNPTKPDRPALSRKRQASFNNTDGQAGSPPPQCPPDLVWIRNRDRARGKPRPIGVPGMALCQKNLTAACRAPHKVHAGLPRGARFILVLPATRKAAGAPSAWSQPSQSTHARPRRWCDAGSPGRQCVTADQKAGVDGMARNNGSDRDRGRIHIRIRGR